MSNRGSTAIIQVIVAPIRAAAFLLALGAAIFSLAALGGVVSRRLDVLTHFAPFYLAAGLLALTLGVITGLDAARPTISLSVAAMAFAGALIAPELLAMLNRSPPPATGQTVKVLQFNLWVFNPVPEATAKWIIAQDADVLILEEADDGARTIPHLLKAHYPYASSCRPIYPCATTIMTKVKPTATSGLYLPPTKLAGVWVTLGTGKQAYSVVGVHYARPTTSDMQHRQMLRLADVVSDFDKGNVIVAGDMNLTPWSYALRRQDVRLGLERRTRALFTWPAAAFSRWNLTSPVPLLPIDQVYAGRDWKTVSVTAGPKQGSDHLPVTVVLRRPL